MPCATRHSTKLGTPGLTEPLFPGVSALLLPIPQHRRWCAMTQWGWLSWFSLGVVPCTFPEVCVDAHVSCGPCQALVLAVRDVFFGLRVDVLFGQAKINDVDGVLPLAPWPPHQEVLWFDVSVDEAFGVNVFHPCDLGGRGELASAPDKPKLRHGQYLAV